MNEVEQLHDTRSKLAELRSKPRDEMHDRLNDMLNNLEELRKKKAMQRKDTVRAPPINPEIAAQLSADEARLFEWLKHNNEGHSLNWIVRFYRINPNKLSRILMLLVAKGYVIEKDGYYYPDERSYF